MTQRLSSFIASRKFHVLIIVIGALFMMTDAFHGNVWFDESFSLALVNGDFGSIWTIDASDVHPVLYYWMLWVVGALTDHSLLAYRLFSVAGAVSLAALGYTHIRRDFGWKAGVLFSIFASFSPYVAIMAVEVRMYSWCTFTVMLAFIYAYRIFAAGRQPRRDAPDLIHLKGEKRPYRVPLHYWIVFFVASLASAYLHYFSLLSVFIINVGLGAYLIKNYSDRAHDLARCLACVFAQVLLYVPWLINLYHQLKVVSNTYWVTWQPWTIVELLFYPLYTSQISYAIRSWYGMPIAVLAIGLLAAAAIVLVSCCVHQVRAMRRTRAAIAATDGFVKESRLRRFMAFATSEANLPITLALATYLGLFLIVGIASIVIDQLMLYYRYIFCCIGPLLLTIALLLARIESKRLIGAALAVFFGLAVTNQALLVYDDYNAQNRQPLDYLEDNYSDGELVLSSDIGIEGVTAVQCRDIEQTYLNWQAGSWGGAYRAYEPTLTEIHSWKQALDSYTGEFIVLGATTKYHLPRDVRDILKIDGVKLVKFQTFYRPYEKTYFTIAVCEKGDDQSEPEYSLDSLGELLGANNLTGSDLELDRRR